MFPMWKAYLKSNGWPFLLGTALLLLGHSLGLLVYFPALFLLTFAALRLKGKHLAPWQVLVLSLPLWLFCLLAQPDLSDDHHRYLWEGYVQNQGYSPYLNSPEALAERIDHPSKGKVNHPEFTAIYPPLAQLCFRLAALLSTSLLAWKLLIVLALLLVFSSQYGRQHYAWLLSAPLLLVEGVWHGHLDVLGVVAAIGLLWAMEKRSAYGAGILLGCLVGIKLLPALLGPACLLALQGRDRWRFLAAGAVTVVLIFLPFHAELPQVFASFRAFAGQWYFNNPLFMLLDAWLPTNWARPALGAALLSGVVLLLLPKRDLRWRFTATWLLLLLCSPTVYPWYLLWLLAFAPRDRTQWVQIAYAASFLSYLILIPYRATGVWQSSLWWLLPEWAVLCYCGYRLLAAPALVAGEPEPNPGDGELPKLSFL